MAAREIVYGTARMRFMLGGTVDREDAANLLPAYITIYSCLINELELKSSAYVLPCKQESMKSTNPLTVLIVTNSDYMMLCNVDSSS